MFIKRHLIFSFITVILILLGCSDNELIGISSNKTPTIKFVKDFGGSKNDAFRSVINTSDGGYAILGFTQSIDGDIVNDTDEQYDYWLLKFDINDNLQWQRFYGGSKEDRGEKIIETNDNGYAIIGFSKSNDDDVSENAGFQDIWILKLDVNGNITWQKSFGFSGADQGLSILQTKDNGYFICGILDVTASGGLGNKSTSKNKHAGGDFWGLKLDSSGNLIWRNYFGGTNTDTCYDAIETNDGFLLIGSSDSNDVDIKANKGSYDYWIAKINNNGTLVWEKSIGGSEIENAYQISSSSDGNFILVGETRSNDQDISNQNGGADVWIVKIDSEGNIIWERNYGGTSFDAARSITPTNDGNFVIVGSSRSSDIDVSQNNGQNDIWTFKIDTNGKLLWEKSIGGTDIDFAYGVTQLKNGSIIVVGDSNSSDQDIQENKGFTDAIIIKIDEE